MTRNIILSGKWLSAYNESLIECADDDNDNYNSCGYDCDDSNFRINIGTYEYPGNSLDENCDGVKVCNPQDEWRNYGEYVSCVVKEANLLYRQGLIDNKERAKIVASVSRLGIGFSKLVDKIFSNSWTDVTGAVSHGIQKPAASKITTTNDDCPSPSEDEIYRLKEELNKRAGAVGKTIGLGIRSTVPEFIDEAEAGLNYIVADYWNLDTNINGEERKHYEPIRTYNRDELDILTLKNNPELQKLDPSCASTKVKKMRESVKYLNWIWLPTCCASSIYNFYTPPKRNEFYWKKGFARLEDAGIHESFGQAWDAAIYRYNNPLSYGEQYDPNKGEQAWGSRDDNIAAGCDVANYGSGQWYWHWCPPGSGIRCSEQGSTWGAERYYRECNLKNLDFSGLSFEPESVRIYYGLARCDGNCEQMIPEGEVEIGELGSFKPIEKQGDYLIGDFKNNLELKGFRGNVKISVGLVNDELKPAESIPMGETRTTGPKYVKGVNENFVFRGFIVSAFVIGDCEKMGPPKEEGSQLGGEKPKGFIRSIISGLVDAVKGAIEWVVKETILSKMSNNALFTDSQPIASSVIENKMRSYLEPYICSEYLDKIMIAEKEKHGLYSAAVIHILYEDGIISCKTFSGLSNIIPGVNIPIPCPVVDERFRDNKNFQLAYLDLIRKAGYFITDILGPIIVSEQIDNCKLCPSENLLRSNTLSYFVKYNFSYLENAEIPAYSIEPHGYKFLRDYTLTFNDNSIILKYSPEFIKEKCFVKEGNYSKIENIGKEGKNIIFKDMNMYIPDGAVSDNQVINLSLNKFICFDRNFDGVIDLDETNLMIEKWREDKITLFEILRVIDLWSRS